MPPPGDTINNGVQLRFTQIVGLEIYFHNPKYSVGNIRIETNNLGMPTTNRYGYILIPGAVLGSSLGEYEDILQDNVVQVTSFVYPTTVSFQ